MTIYFAFSDECGDYRSERSTYFNTSHPFYIRSSLLMKSNDWLSLQKKFLTIKEKYNIPIEKEVKWSYLWSLWYHKVKNNEKIAENKPYYFLREFEIETLAKFIKDSLMLVSDIEASITITVFPNESNIDYQERNFLKMHIQNIMQRIEMEIQSSNNNLCVLFVDPINPDKDRLLRNAYHDIFIAGDFIKEYKHIKDSLNMEFSHHSIGIQLADYIAGAFTGFLKDYDTSKDIIKCCILPKLRKNPENGQIIGYGVIDVPNIPEFRKFLVKRLEKLDS